MNSSESVSVPSNIFDGVWDDLNDGTHVRVWDMREPGPASLEFVVVPFVTEGSQLRNLASLPHLSVVQSMSAGVDQLRPYIPPGVALCNAAGVHEAGTSELAVGLALACLRGIGRYSPTEIHGGSWSPPFRPSLADRRVAVVGVGRIGQAVIARLRPFECTIIGVASRAREDNSGLSVVGVESLHEVLQESDVVILCLPLNESTSRIIDAEALEKMPDESVLINVGRGGLVDTAALEREVMTGRICVGLDVTEPEPLPLDSPLWSSSNAIITPHIGGSSTAFYPRIRSLVKEQVRRFTQGEELLNLVIA